MERKREKLGLFFNYWLVTAARLKRDPLVAAWYEERLKDAQEILRRDYKIEYAEKLGDDDIKKFIEYGHGITIYSREDERLSDVQSPYPLSVKMGFNSRGEYHLEIDLNLTMFSFKRHLGYVMRKIKEVIKWGVSERDKTPARQPFPGARPYEICKYLSGLSEGLRAQNTIQPFPGAQDDIKRELILLDYYEESQGKGSKKQRMLTTARKIGIIDYAKLSALEIPSAEAKAVDNIRKRLNNIYPLVYGEPFQNSKTASELKTGVPLAMPCNNCEKKDTSRCLDCPTFKNFSEKDPGLKFHSSYTGLGLPADIGIE